MPAVFEYNPQKELPYSISDQEEGAILSCHEDSFDILQPQEYIPKAGDRIVITNKGSLNFGRIFIIEKVIEFDDNYLRISSQDLSRSHQGWFGHGAYETIKQTKSPIDKNELCGDCGGTGKITLLISDVPCECALAGTK